MADSGLKYARDIGDVDHAFETLPTARRALRARRFPFLADMDCVPLVVQGKDGMFFVACPAHGYAGTPYKSEIEAEWHRDYTFACDRGSQALFMLRPGSHTNGKSLLGGADALLHYMRLAVIARLGLAPGKVAPVVETYSLANYIPGSLLQDDAGSACDGFAIMPLVVRYVTDDDFPTSVEVLVRSVGSDTEEPFAPTTRAEVDAIPYYRAIDFDAHGRMTLRFRIDTGVDGFDRALG